MTDIRKEPEAPKKGYPQSRWEGEGGPPPPEAIEKKEAMKKKPVARSKAR